MSDSTPKRFAVIHCGQLVTLAGKRGPRHGAAEMRELAIIEDGAMLIADGKIEWNGNHGRIAASAGSGENSAGHRCARLRGDAGVCGCAYAHGVRGLARGGV